MSLIGENFHIVCWKPYICSRMDDFYENKQQKFKIVVYMFRICIKFCLLGFGVVTEYSDHIGPANCFCIDHGVNMAMIYRNHYRIR